MLYHVPLIYVTAFFVYFSAKITINILLMVKMFRADEKSNSKELISISIHVLISVFSTAAVNLIISATKNHFKERKKFQIPVSSVGAKLGVHKSRFDSF